MIHTFGDARTEDIYHGRNTARTRGLSVDIVRATGRKLDMINAAHTLSDLASPGNNLEALKGNLAGYHSIRVNDQWRVIFRWSNGAYGVKLVDYH